MNNLKEFISSIDFDYIITYSGLRGEPLDLARKEVRVRIREIENEIRSENFKDKAILRREKASLYGIINIDNSRPVNKNGELHMTSIAIKNMTKSDSRVVEILKILSMTCDSPEHTRCSPIYRDTIVFYSKNNQITGILHFCFQCNSIITEDNIKFDTNSKIMFSLNLAFRNLGHPIEQDYE